MSERQLFSEEYLENHGSGYYLICKRLAPEWRLEAVTQEDLQALAECSCDFNEAFQYKVVFVGATSRMVFSSDGSEEADEGVVKYEPSVVLLVKRESGIPGEEETNRRMCKLYESEQQRFMAREQAKGRKGGKFRGCREYTGEDLADLGVFMHRVSLRMANCWLERHGGVKRRVFLSSFRSFLIDAGVLELLHYVPHQGETSDETASPTWYVQDGVIGTKEFHRSTRKLDERGLRGLENERNRIEEELLYIFGEHVVEVPLKEKAKELLSLWGPEIKGSFFRAFMKRGNDPISVEIRKEFLLTLLIGVGHFGWCMSSEVVKRTYQRFRKKSEVSTHLAAG